MSSCKMLTFIPTTETCTCSAYVGHASLKPLMYKNPCGKKYIREKRVYPPMQFKDFYLSKVLLEKGHIPSPWQLPSLQFSYLVSSFAYPLSNPIRPFPIWC